MKRKMTLNRETLLLLGGSGDEQLRKARGGYSTTCPVPSICRVCPTHVGYHTCYKTCH